jgi:hypothetical protein
MNETMVRLRTHRNNIDRYEALLQTMLTAAEKQFVEKRLSEERLAIALLQVSGPAASARNGHDRPEAPE